MSRLRQPSPAPAAASPCVRNCCLDDDQVCLGCGRRLDEILRWRDATPEEREAMATLARQRHEQHRRRWLPRD